MPLSPQGFWPEQVSAANLAGCGAILLWSFLAPLSRAAARAPAFQLVAFSFAVSALFGLGWLWVRGSLRQLRQPGVVWLHGVGGLFGFHALYFASLAMAPAAEANLINYTWPLLIVLLSAVGLGMRLERRHWLGLGLALTGCAALLSRGAAFPAGALAGYGLAACSACVWAGYSVLARRFGSVPVGAVAGFCGGTAALAGATQALLGGFVALSRGEWLAVLAMGLGPVGAAFALWDLGMKRGDPRLLGTFAFAIPVLSTALLAAGGWTAFTGTTVLAAVLVAAGGLVASR